MDSDEDEEGIECPVCKTPQIVKVYTMRELTELRCQIESCGSLLQVGKCKYCKNLVSEKRKQDRTVMICDKCRGFHTVNSSIDRLIRKLTETIDCVQEETKSELTAIKKTLAQFGEQLDSLAKRPPISCETLKQFDSVRQYVSNSNQQHHQVLEKTGQNLLVNLTDANGATRQEIERLSRKIEALPIGELDEQERNELVELIYKPLNAKLVVIITKLLGPLVLSDGKRKYAYSDVPSMLQNQLEGIESKLIMRIEAAVAALATTRIRGKNDGPTGIALSFNLSAIEAFVDRTKRLPFLNIVKQLPELFNRIEVDLKHRQETLKQADDDTDRAVVDSLEKINESFVNWQLANNVFRLPEKEGETFDPKVHDIVRTLPTDLREHDRHVAEIDRYGYVFRDGDGELILQKAEVAVWDLGKNR